MSIDWLGVSLYAFVKIFTIVTLMDGVRLLTQRDFSRKAVLTAAIGIVMCATWAAVNYYKYQAVTSILVTLRSANPIKLPPYEEWSSSLSPEQKEELGREVASHDYYRNGTLKKYIDRSGSLQVFTPSQEQISERETNVAQLAQLEFLADARYSDAIEWAIWGILAVLIGFSSGKRLKKDCSPAGGGDV